MAELNDVERKLMWSTLNVAFDEDPRTGVILSFLFGAILHQDQLSITKLAVEASRLGLEMIINDETYPDEGQKDEARKHLDTFEKDTTEILESVQKAVERDKEVDRYISGIKGLEE